VTPIAKLGAIPGAFDAAPAATPPERIPHVDEEECVGCNLCWLVCPAPGSITMEKVPLGKDSESWHQRTRSHA
jgi:dihydropyrimidine dehydrogenase (NAD+) subunit PreA